ncbi:MAG: MlaE family ABC transporter permease [Puniceicoccaceae bacterium]
MKGFEPGLTVEWIHTDSAAVARLRKGAEEQSASLLPPSQPPKNARTLILEIGPDLPTSPLLLAHLHRLCRWAEANQITTDFSRLPGEAVRLLELSTSTPLRPIDPAPPERFLEVLGLASFAVASKVTAVVQFIGEVARGSVSFFLGRSVTRSVDLLDNFLRCGLSSLPIVSLIAFLVGLIISFVAAVQLALFGATIFVADLISIVMFRELGVMMTGILLAGRIGAAFAAEIGSMRSNEEIDALSTSGINPIQFLVVPRFLALLLATPILSIYASVIGVLGGMFMASGLMGVVPEQFFGRVSEAMSLGNLWAGVIKGFVFGAIIAITGCLKGLHAERGAEGVGRATTSTVVTSITWIIIADSAFAIFLYFCGI